jgi:hypothetical protein
MTEVDHVEEAETLLRVAEEAQPTDEAALLVARAQVHATLAVATVAHEQPGGPAPTATTTATPVPNDGHPDGNGRAAGLHTRASSTEKTTTD